MIFTLIKESSNSLKTSMSSICGSTISIYIFKKFKKSFKLLSSIISYLTSTNSFKLFNSPDSFLIKNNIPLKYKK